MIRKSELPFNKKDQFKGGGQELYKYMKLPQTPFNS